MASTLTPARDTSYRLGFTSLDREVRVEALPVEGTLPPWLSGTLLRNGPARFTVGNDNFRHWFDGLGMVHRFAIGGGGGVAYANRFLRSPAFTEAERSGSIARAEFATDPRRTRFQRLRSPFGAGPPSHNANVNIVPFADGYLALTETPSPVAFDGVSLETRGPLGYVDDVRGQITTAHTHYDPVRRATFNIVIDVGRVSHYHVVRIADGTLRRDVVGSLAVGEPAYTHAFFATSRFIVLAEYPLVVRPLELLLRRKPFIDNYRWRPARGTRFHVFDKDSGTRTGSFESAAFFAFHPINAYDDGDSVVLDVSAYDDAGVIADFMLANLRAPGPVRVAQPAFCRYRLVPGSPAAQVETSAGIAIELARVAGDREARPYRYAYGVAVGSGDANFIDGLVKLAVDSQTAAYWSAPGTYPGEPVFVPRPGAADEDDGVLLSVVLDAAAGRSFLLVLDARTLAELARAIVPHHIPFGFHGLFVKG